MAGTQGVELFSAAQLKKLREERKWNKSQAARRTDMKQPAYSRMEAGKHKPNMKTLLNLVKCFNCEGFSVKIEDFLQPLETEELPSLERLRTCRGLTKAEAADLLGIRREDYSAIEAGDEPVDSRQTFDLIARLYKADPGQLEKVVKIKEHSPPHAQDEP